MDNNEKEREKKARAKKKKGKKLKGCRDDASADEGRDGGTRDGERVHVDIQFSSDQKVEGNGGGGEMPVSPPLSGPFPSSVRGF